MSLVDQVSAASTSPTQTPAEAAASPKETTPVAAPAAAAPVVADAKATITDPTATKAEKAAAVKTLKKYNIKVFGQDKTVELDINDDAAVTKHLQMGAAAQRSMAETAEIRKAAMQLIEDLKKNPRKVLSDPAIGLDVKKFAEQIMNDQIAELEKSPEQREKEALKAELEEARGKVKKAEQDAKDKEFTRLQGEQERILEAEFSAALDMGGLPKTPRTVKQMAEMMMLALQNNIDLSPKDLVPIVKNSTMSEFKEILSSLSDDQLEDYVGKDILNRIRKRNVSKVKAPETAASIKATGKDVKVKGKDEKELPKQTYKNFFGF